MDVSYIPCEDYTYFKEKLDQLRKNDDHIAHNLNSLIDRSSKEKELNTCGELFRRLNETHRDRIRLIRRCVSETEGRLKHMRLQVDQLHSMGKETEAFHETLSLDRLRHNYRLMESEFVVEDIIRDRVLKLFNERCRLFSLVKSSQRAAGDDDESSPNQ